MKPDRVLLILVFALAAVSAPASSQTPQFQRLRSASEAVVEGAGFGRVERPLPPGTGPSVEITLYETDEEFTFESGAQEALDARLAAFARAGVKTLGGRVSRKANRRWTFVIEYLPSLEPGGNAPAAVVAGRYTAPAAYWRKQDAEQALAEAVSRMSGAGLGVIGGEVVDAGRDHSFQIDYLMADRLGRGRNDRVRIDRAVVGRFTFESGAEAAMPELASRFERAGVRVLNARAVRRPDRDYSVEVEYAARANASGSRPEFSIVRYDAKETFSFDHQALAAARALLPAFAVEGAAPLHAFVREAGRDYSFSVDFFVRNLYRYGRVQPAVSVRSYRAAEVYDFERQAEAALDAKKEAFRSAGISVLGGRVVEVGRDYSYELDYFDPARAEEPRRPRRDDSRG